MQHHRDLSEVSITGSLLTIGSFDGVHIGHQQIIEPMIARAHQKGLPAVVVTFHPHPQLVIHDEIRPYYLTLPEKRAQLLGELGVDHVLTYPFSNSTSDLSPEEFVSSLHESFRFQELWVGYDFALGKDRKGTPTYLRELGKKNGFTIHEVEPYYLNGELVSSSRIRKALREGNVTEANRLLGRVYQVTGVVIEGEKRGKSLGFATSNLDVPSEVVDIKPGVYACQVEVDRETYSGVTNIGYRPTFGDDLMAPRIETHLLDFSRDLYGKRLEIGFIQRLRDEKKFSQVDELIEQIAQDVEKTREILA